MAPSAPVLACLPLVSLARLMVAQCRDLVGPQAVVAVFSARIGVPSTLYYRVRSKHNLPCDLEQ